MLGGAGTTSSSQRTLLSITDTHVEAYSQEVVEEGSEAEGTRPGSRPAARWPGEPSCVSLARCYNTAVLKSRTNCRTRDPSDETGKSKAQTSLPGPVVA